MDVDARGPRGHRGWAAGIVFEALRRPQAGRRLPTTEGPLFSYLGEEILHELSPRPRRALLRTAVLDTVTDERLARLPQERPARDIEELSRLHLPGDHRAAGAALPPAVPRVPGVPPAPRAAGRGPAAAGVYGRLLAEEEEAVDVLLQGGRRDEAEALAERTVTPLRRRGDWSKVLAWTEALGEEALRRRPILREAQVRALLNARRQEELEDLVHEMLATGEVGELVESAPDVAAWAVWALHGSGEWAKLIPLLPRAGVSAWPR